MGQTKDAAEGVRCLEEGFAAFNRLGLRRGLSLAICLLAETYFMARRYEQGMEQANLAIAASSEMGDRSCLPRIHLIRSKLLQQSSCDDAAAASLRTAIEVAASQCAKGPQLRAATSLARLWSDQGKRNEARELLAPVYGWFTEGFDTPDLREAKSMLDELASSMR
jgi:predicted ATPase